MGSFQFRLEKVWQHRRRVVDERSVDVAAVNREVATLSRQIVEIEASITSHAQTLVRSKGDSLQPRDLVRGGAWREHLLHLRTDLDGKLQKAVKNLERSRSRLTDSWRDLEVLTRLRDRGAEDWQMGQDSRDRKEMDEIGQIRAFRHRATKDSPVRNKLPADSQKVES